MLNISQKFSILLSTVLLSLSLFILTRAAVLAEELDQAKIHSVQSSLERLLPQLSSQITLAAIPPKDGKELFRISSRNGHLLIQGSSQSALLFGVNWYLKYVAHLQISTNGVQLNWRGKLPLPEQAIQREALYSYRYALNENTDGYSSPYWDWTRWQREIDVLALNGINAMLIERGTDLVLYETFRDLGFSDREIRNWITQPAHQNWQLMGNMCCFDEPISMALLRKRARSAQRILAQLRSLGITPVLPGYYGIVPATLAGKYPQAHIVPQGDWNGFERPAWLDPRDPLFAKIAASFYRHQRELFGDTSIYDMEVFQEGGNSGNVPIGEGARRIQSELLKAHPQAFWMMLAWQNNPSMELLQGVNRKQILIVDIEQGHVPKNNRQADFLQAPFLFGGLWEFGGRTTLGANLYDYAIRLPEVGQTSTNMVGTAVFPEGMDNNPFAFDLFTEMAWRSQAVDLDQWTSNYATRRYGRKDPHAFDAWRILLKTVYGNRADGVTTHGERESAQESLFNAQPDLNATRASSWGPDAIRYQPGELNQALIELLQVSPSIRQTETYQYDLVDVARQVLANQSRILLPQVKDAYEKSDRPRFQILVKRWLALMQLQDKLLSSNEDFLLGSWLRYVVPWASSPAEYARLSYDARSILTTWGNRRASEAGLHDYGNKDWAGLTKDYYLKRWQRYFEALDASLRTHTRPEPIDWFAIGDKWNREQQPYPTKPLGDPYVVATQIASQLGLTLETSSHRAQ